MKKEELNVDTPCNAHERYLHALVVRVDALCHMVDSLVTYIAEKEGVATESVEVKEKAKKPAARPAQRKRTTKKKEE